MARVEIRMDRWRNRIVIILLSTLVALELIHVLLEVFRG